MGKKNIILTTSNIVLTVTVCAVFLGIFITLPNIVPIMYNNINGVIDIIATANKLVFLPILIISLILGIGSVGYVFYKNSKSKSINCNTVNIVSLVVNGILLLVEVFVFSFILLAI